MRRREWRTWALIGLALASALQACGGGGDSGGSAPDWQAGANQAAFGLAVQGGQVQFSWTDTLDGEQGWRVEGLSGANWQTAADLPASSGTGSKRSVTLPLAQDTTYRLLAVLPGGGTAVAMSTGGKAQLQARASWAGAGIEFSTPAAPVSGNTTVRVQGVGAAVSVRYTLGGNSAPAGSTTGPDYSVPWASGTLADGSYVVSAAVEWEPGNVYTLTRSVPVHNSGVTVTATADVSLQAVTLKLALSANAAGPGVTVSVDGTLWKQQTLANGWQVTDWPVALGALPAGAHDLLVQAKDSTGANASTTLRISVPDTTAGLVKVKSLDSGYLRCAGTYIAARYASRLAIGRSCYFGNSTMQLILTTTAADTGTTGLGRFHSPIVEMNADWTFAFDGFDRISVLVAEGTNSYGSNWGCDGGTCPDMRAVDLPVRNWVTIGPFYPVPSYLVDVNTGMRRNPIGYNYNIEPLDPGNGHLQWYVRAPSSYALYDATLDTLTPLPLNPTTDFGLISDGRRLVWMRSIDPNDSATVRLVAAPVNAPTQEQLVASDYRRCSYDENGIWFPGPSAAAGLVAWCELAADGVTRTLKVNDGSSTRVLTSSSDLQSQFRLSDVGEGAVAWVDERGVLLWTPAGGAQLVVAASRRASQPVLTQHALFLIIDDVDLYRLDY